MEITVREIYLEDSKAVTDLTEQLGYALSDQETRDRIKYVLLNKEHCGYLAIADEKPVGWIQAFIAMRIESKRFIEISGLVVDENYRGKGVGQKLIDKVKEWSANKNCESLRVRCNIKRTESHKFYRKLGFTEYKEQKIFHLDL